MTTTPLTLYFTEEAEFYNAVYFANAIGDAYRDQYDIKLQYRRPGTVANASQEDLNTYDSNRNGKLDASELTPILDKLIGKNGNNANELFGGVIVDSGNKISDGQTRSAGFGHAPAIRHDLTITFYAETDASYGYDVGTNLLEYITTENNINGRDFVTERDLAAHSPITRERGIFQAGIKIDDFDPNRKINVTLNGLWGTPGAYLPDKEWSLNGGSLQQYPAVGVFVENNENLTINGMVLGNASVVGQDKKPTLPAAPVINKGEGSLTLTGDIIIGNTFNYENSFAFNQGNLVIDNAKIRVFDKNQPTVLEFHRRFGGFSRPKGAINNVGTLLIKSSQLWQEADNLVNPNTLTDAPYYKQNVEGLQGGGNDTPNWTAPRSLEYLISNKGSTSITGSIIAGVVRQDTNPASSLWLEGSHLGYGESGSYENLIIDKGSYSIKASTVDKLASGVRPTTLSNSVILSSEKPNVVAANSDFAYQQFLDPSQPSLFKGSKEIVNLLTPRLTSEFWRTTYDPAQLNPAVQAAVTTTLQGSQAANPTVTRIQLGFGTTLAASEKQQAQSITAFTHDIPDGSPLTLQLNNKQYQATVTGNQAAFTIPASDLAALPTGTASAVVNGLLNGKAIPSQQATFSVDGQTFAAVPHITAILPSFGTVLEAAELQQAQTLLVTTTGLEAGRQLTLELDGTSNSAISGGVVQANGEASFSLPASVLASLNGGLHRFRVSGSNAAGTAAPPAELPFSADGAHNIAVTPHVLSIVPSFGAVLSNLEATSNQSVVVTTENLNNGDQLQLSLYGKNYTASITNNSASFTLPAADLQALPSGTDFLTISGPISPAGAAQLATTQQSFTKDGATALQPHILSITPAFGHVLDLTEAGTNQTVTVSTDNFGSGGSLTLRLAGKTYAPTSFSNGVGSFTLPAADIAALSAGTTSLVVNGGAAGLSAPELLYSFVVDKTNTPPLVPAITSIAPSFGAVLDLNERTSAQTVVVSTRDIADNQILSLTLNGKTYNANTSANQASFAIPAADLQALPSGLSTLRVTPSGQNTPAAEFTISSEAPALASTPHVLSIVASFGAVLTVAEAQQQQTVSVSTEGIENNQPLVLRSSNGLILRGIVNNNQAVFALTPQQLQSFPVGLDSLSVAVANQAGVQAPAASISFAVDGLATAALPHIDRITPAFGALLDSTEAGRDQQVVVDTTGFSNSNRLTLSLAGKTYSAAVDAQGEASFTLPTADLKALKPGVSSLSVTGTNTGGVTAPALARSFTIDGNHLVGHFTHIDPFFGATLDATERSSAQLVAVITEGIPDGQQLQLSLNGKTYQATAAANAASFSIPTADLQALPAGQDRMTVSAPGSSTPDADQAFTVLASSSSGGGSIGGGGSGGGSTSGGGGSGGNSGGNSGGASAQPPSAPGTGNSSTPGLDNDNLDESPENHNGLVIDANKDGIPDASQSNVAGIKRVGDGTSQGDFAALAVAPNFTLNAVTLRPIVNNQVNVSLPSGGSLNVPIPQGITALLEPLEFFVEGVSPGATIEAELFIPDNFNEQTDAYMRFNYQTQRFEEYVDANGQKLYQLLDENGDGKIDRVVFSLTDGDRAWDGDGLANGTIIDPGSPIDAAIRITGGNKRDRITGNLLANTIRGKGGNDRLDGNLGRDVIKGDKGNDRITGGEHGDYLKGGAGKDHFIYHSAADSSADNPNQRDEIARFQRHDRIDLRRFDADITQAGIQHFDFIGKRSFSGQTAELRFHSGILAADLNGDRQADFAVAIDGKLNANQLLLGS